MWKADRWQDYEVLDTDDGEKLERWGKYILVRPDPQVIWKSGRDKSWDRVSAHYHRSSRGGGSWQFFDLPKTWEIGCHVGSDRGEQDPQFIQDLTFRLQPFSFKHTGLFPEQAVNWDWFYDIIRKERTLHPHKPVKVLNLFAYTGGATVSALAAGAEVTHVDASKGMVNWARENAQLSGVADRPVRWLVDDCVKFVEREIRRGKTYDAVIMDPPSYGRGPKGEIWKIEDEIFPLIELTMKILSPRPLFYLINSYTTGLQSSVLSYMMGLTIVKRFGGRVESDEIGLPVTRTGLVLPCGCSGRWHR